MYDHRPPPGSVPPAPKEPVEHRVYDLTEGIEPQVPPSRRGPKRVLLLDDDVDLADMLRDLLSTEGYEVTCVPSGVEGMKIVMAQDFDAILCDLLMPNLPGDMFYLAVTKVKPAMADRFIFISGQQANPKWEAFIRTTKALVLWKPFPTHDLLTCLDVVTQRAKP